MPFTVQSKASILIFAKEHKIEHHLGFKNFSQSVTSPDSIVIEIQTREELQQLIAHVNGLNRNKTPEENVTLRVAAGGKKEYGNTKEYSQSFSFTPCADANIIVRLVGEEFQKVSVVDEKKHIVKVGANVQVGELDNILYHQHKLSLPTSSLIPYVTFVGLAANAGHGTGRDQPAVGGLIRAMTICRPDGKIERIDARHPDFETIRASHFGLFGAVLNVEVECIPAKKLQCVREARTINQLITEIQEGLFYNSSYVSIMYVPTYQADERNQKNVIVFRWEPVDVTVENVSDSPNWDHAEQTFAIGINNLLNIPGFLEHHSSVIPTFMKYFVARTEVGSSDTLKVGPWPDIAHYQTAYPWYLDDSDYLFNTRGKNCNEIVMALEKVVSGLESYAKRGQYPVTDAIYLRFFKGTNGGLSTSATQHPDAHVCGFDIVSAPHVPGYPAFKREMEKFFLDELRAKPHWGKTVPLERDYAEIYGEQYTHFIRVLTKWYKACGLKLENSPFLNSFCRTVLQLPASPALVAQERKDDRRIPAAPADRGAKVARDMLTHIAEAKLDGAHTHELRRKLEAISNEPRFVRVHFTSNEQRNSFLRGIGVKPFPSAEAAALEAAKGKEQRQPGEIVSYFRVG